jgi:hypothetical protein
MRLLRILIEKRRRVMCAESDGTKKIIMLFESPIAKSKSLQNADMLLAELKDIYQSMMPYQCVRIYQNTLKIE